MWNQGLISPCFTTTSTYATLSCRASACSLLGIPRERQLWNEVQCSVPKRHSSNEVPWATRGSFNTFCSYNELLLPQQGESIRRTKLQTKLFVQKRKGQDRDRCLKTRVIWPWICRIVSHICKVCMASLKNTTLHKQMSIHMNMQALSLPPVAISS